jgi:Ti-type conjugative transfer relaxase TraA
VAVPHFSVSILGRGTGRSAVLAAAYRHCARMDYQREARSIDYTAKRGLLHEEFVIPQDAPAWLRSLMADRPVSAASEAFWNAVETFETRSDAQLARDVTIALPCELSSDQNVALMRDFIASHVVSKGMVADWVYHDAPGNPHVHLMMTLRPLTPEGFGGKKVAVLGEDGTALRTSEGKILYRLWAGDRDDFQVLRDAWFSLQNRHLALAGLDIRIDGRSFERQGIDLLATTHIGVGATAIERKSVSAKDKARQAVRFLERIEIQNARRAENARRIEVNPGLVLDLVIREKSVFDVRDVARVLNRHIDDASRFQDLIVRILQDPQILRLDGERIDLGSGLSLPERFTTVGMIRLEAEMVRRSAWLSARSSYLVNRRVLDTILARHAHLSDEQKVALQHVAGACRIAAIVGRAGAGKTTLMKVAREAWEASGYRVIGGALAGKAAEGLQRDAGITARTLSSWELAWAQGRDPLTERTIMVLDEAGMVSSRQMAHLVEAVTRRGAKLVLIGDPEQLQPIEAGAAFRAITERIGYAELQTIYRQRDNWMRAASLDLAKGRPLDAIAAYEVYGRVFASALKGQAIDRLIADWDRDYRPDRSCLILAHLRRDVRALNARARERLVERGLVGAGHDFRSQDGLRQFAAGDQIIFLKNDASLGVKNGMLAAVVDAGSGRIVAETIDGAEARRITIEQRFYNSVDHGYATTIHKAQGATVDRVKLLASLSLDRHLTYVAMTRHREDLGIYYGSKSFAKAGGLVALLSRRNPKETTLDYDKGRFYHAALRFADRRGLRILSVARQLLRQRLEWTLRQKERLFALTARLSSIGARLGLKSLEPPASRLDGRLESEGLKPMVSAVSVYQRSIAEIVEARLGADPGLQAAWQDVGTRFGHVYADPEAAFRAINLEGILSDPPKVAVVITSLSKEPQAFGALKGTTRLLAARVNKEMLEIALVNAPALARALERYVRARGQRRACYEAEEMTLRSKVAIAIPALSPAAQKVLDAAREAIDCKDRPLALQLACADGLVKGELDAFIRAVIDRFGERSLLPAAAGAVDGKAFRVLTAGMDKGLQVQMRSAWNLMRTAMQINAHERSVMLGNRLNALTLSERQSTPAVSAQVPGPGRDEPPHKGVVLK